MIVSGNQVLDVDNRTYNSLLRARLGHQAPQGFHHHRPSIKDALKLARFVW